MSLDIPDCKYRRKEQQQIYRISPASHNSESHAKAQAADTSR